MSDRFTIAAFAGSLRARSYNKALLRAAVARAPSSLDIQPFDLADMPLYNGDVEDAGDPAPVQALKEALHAADGLLIVSPEYNASMTAVTKNAIDWASRPPKPTALAGLPVAVTGATPGRLGTARMQGHLRVSLANTNARVMAQPQLYVANAGEVFDEDLKLQDEATQQFLTRFLESFAAWVATPQAA